MEILDFFEGDEENLMTSIGILRQMIPDFNLPRFLCRLGNVLNTLGKKEGSRLRWSVFITVLIIHLHLEGMEKLKVEDPSYG